MKKIISLTFVLFFVSHATFAVFLPDYEKPIFYERVDRVTLVLNRRDDSMEPTSISINILWDDGTGETRVLPIVSRKRDSCGSVTYVAGASDRNYERYLVTLVDYSSGQCRAFNPFLWKASVRHGYDFVGEMEGSMELYGNPLVTYSIQ